MINIDFFKSCFILLSYFLGGLLLFACSQSPSIIKKAEKIHFQKTVWHTKSFSFASWVKIHKNNTTDLVIYIEGDGRLMNGRNRLSTDPTPKNPLSFKLAIQDTKGTVIYLGRPCQYLSADVLKNCPSKYWFNGRYADEVVKGFNQTLNKIIKKYQIKPKSIGIVGFSGGSTLAVLLASRRKDINWIITIAGNLDLKAWVDYHHAAPLIGSLSALDVAFKLKNIPQRHFWGDKDRVISKNSVQNYVDKAGHREWLKIIKNYNHHCCWSENWLDLICDKQQKIDNNNLNKPWLKHYCIN